MIRWPVPSPSPILVGRDDDLERLERGMALLSVGLVYGVAGVGKSALAYAYAARWPGETIYRRVRPEPLAALLNDVRRQLAGKPVPEVVTDEERLINLVSRLDAGPWLLVLDDLHQLGAAAGLELVDTLASALGRGRLLATSRERIPRLARGADRFELHLEALTDAAARALWTRLDALYAPGPGPSPAPAFERANARGRGNPFQLRRAHAGGLEDDDPIAAGVRALDADQRRVAGALALAGWRLPLTTLAGLMPEDRARSAVRRLVALLIADVDGAGTAGLQNLFQEAVLAELSAAERAMLHADLATAMADVSFDLVVRVREVARHLCAIERHADAGWHLGEHATEMIRQGATGELLRALDAIPPPHRSADARMIRARCLGRILDTPGAREELERLVALGCEPVHDIQLALADTLLVGGDVGRALDLLRGVLASPALAEPVRRGALASYAVALTHAGRGDEARALLAKASASTEDPDALAQLAFWSICTSWLEERDSECEDLLLRVKRLLPDVTVDFAGGSLVPLTIAAVMARLGRFTEVEQLVRAAAVAGGREEDPYSQAYAQRMHAAIAYETGDRWAALVALEAVSEAYEGGGCTLPALWANTWIGRILLLVGRCAEGTRLLDETERRGRAAGADNIVASVARAREADPRTTLRRAARGREAAGAPAPRVPATMHRSTRIRSRVFEALRHAAAGQEDQARAILAELAEVSAGPGYGLDRAIAHLASATLARVSGAAAEASVEVQRAVAEASADRVDPDVVPALLDQIGGVLVVTSAARRTAIAAPTDLNRYDVVLDGRSHELRVGERRVSLERRPMMRRLLYAMASRPNEVLSKPALAASLWPSRYDPERHDNALWVNLRRLRVLLADSGLQVELDEAGYKLTVPQAFVFVDSSGPEA